MGKTIGNPALSSINLGNVYNKSLPSTAATTAGSIGDFASGVAGAIPTLTDAENNALLSSITGTGGQAATAAQTLNRNLNSDYYSTLDSASSGAKSAIGAINLGGLSPGEEAATERSLNQTNVGGGNLGLNNGTNIVSNAMNFGGAFNNKIGLMDNAVNTATGVANTAAGNAGFNPISVATGGLAPANTLATTATGANEGLSNALMSMISGNNAAATSGNYANSSANSVPNYLSSSGSLLGGLSSC